MKNDSCIEKEAEAQQLAQEVQQAALDEILQMARTLVEKGDAELFGDTELEIRDQLLKIGRLLYQKRLEQKKTATMEPPANARAVSARLTSKDTDHGAC